MKLQQYFRQRAGTQGAGRGNLGAIGAHLDENFGDGDMIDEDFADDKPQALNAGGSHNHTQSCQIPQNSIVNL